MLECVRQPLLHDPVSRQVDTLRQRTRRALDHKLDGQPGVAYLVPTSSSRYLQARLRCQRNFAVEAAQQPQETT